MTDAPAQRSIEELVAGDQFLKSLIERADADDGFAPLWHGWALMDSFLAGIDWARKNDAAEADAARLREVMGEVRRIAGTSDIDDASARFEMLRIVKAVLSPTPERGS